MKSSIHLLTLATLALLSVTACDAPEEDLDLDNWRFAEPAPKSDDVTVPLEPSFESEDVYETVTLDDGTEASFFDEGDGVGMVIVGSSPGFADWLSEVREAEATPLEVYLSLVSETENSSIDLLDELERHHAASSDDAPRSFGVPVTPLGTGTTTGTFNICASNPPAGVSSWISFFVNTLSTNMQTYYHESLETGNGTYTLPVAQFKDLGLCVVDGGTLDWFVQRKLSSGWVNISAATRTVDEGEYVFYENTSGTCGQRRARVTFASNNTYNVSGSVRNASQCVI